MAELEIRSLVDEAKLNIKHFYDNYDRRMRENITHPLFLGLDGDPEKVTILNDQVDMLETEMAKRVRELISNQTILKKDQIATKKRMSELVTDKQLDITLSSYRNSMQDQLTRFSQEMLELKAVVNNLKFEFGTQLQTHMRGVMYEQPVR